MIIMNLEIDNFFCFKDFSINFSYKRKLNKSTIPYEYLEDYPNFRFKKLNILMGSNASGKTVFGKMLRAISNFIEYRNPLYLIEAVNFLDKKANFKLDFVSSNFEKKKVLSQLEVTIFKNTIERIEYNETILEKKDSYKKTLERLLNNENKIILFNKKEKVITDKMNELLEKNGECLFTDLIVRKGNLLDIVCAFMAILEAVKFKMASIWQNRMFGDIKIKIWEQGNGAGL